MNQNPSEKKTDGERPTTDSDRTPREPRVTGTLAYLSLGFEFLGAFLMFAALGYFLDYLWSESGRPGLFFILGLFLGFGGGIWHLIRRTGQLQQWEEEYAAAQDGPEARRARDEDIRTRVDRIQRGVDAVHRKLGETLDASPGRGTYTRDASIDSPEQGGSNQSTETGSEPPSGSAS